jgi:membrane-bound inhibitor of C-type lysozyme
MKWIWFLSKWMLLSVSLFAGDITIHLDGVSPVSRRLVEYRCDASAVRLGLPKGAFQVEYINGGGNSLAILPIQGKTTIFVNVQSGSGSRYVSQEYTWWEAAGRRVILRRVTFKEAMESSCSRVPAP